MAKKQSKQPGSPTPDEDPAWLRQQPEGRAPAPPTQTRQTQLPFTQLAWSDFERLCLRLAERGGSVERVWSYGAPGQAQFGIDVLVRLSNGDYEVWQSKRYKNIKPADIARATDLFLAHKWARQAKRFVLAVACELNNTNVVDALQAARDRLAAASIAFDPLGAAELSRKLVTEPEIVDDFFGRPWAEAVCPPEAGAILTRRLSRFALLDLRLSLRNWYRHWIATVDPGLPIINLGRDGRAAPAIPLLERYVRPDLVIRLAEVPTELRPADENTSAGPSEGAPSAGGPSEPLSSEQSRRTRNAASVGREQRTELDRFLLSEPRAIIAADAGVGKSTLLRAVALDVLADAPQLAATRDRYVGYLPVWVPFALWTRMASERSSPPSLEEVVRAFFEAQSRPKLGEEIAQALASERVLLLVDGLDEASDATAARTVAAVLATLVEARDLPALITTRPHGLQSMGGFAGSWARAELALLSDAQRHALAKLWFRVLVSLEENEAADGGKHEAQAEWRTNSFIGALQRNPGLARLSQNPLFLLALMQLHRHGHELPRSRFAAIDKIIDQLMEHQPRRRATEALTTISPLTMPPRQRDRLLDDLAFAMQSGELLGPVTDAVAEVDAVARGAAIVIRRQGSQDQDKAEEAARSVFVFAEERVGLLVKKAPRAIGFLHLAIQEFLAARHLSQCPLTIRQEFMRTHATNPRWREPILYLLYQTRNEAEVGELVRAIEQATASDLYGKHIRHSLLTDAVFADFSHDLPIAREMASRMLDEAELVGWGPTQRHVLQSAVDGLASEAVGHLCRARIAQWTPNRHGYGRAAAIREMAKWPQSTHDSCRHVLLRCLSADENTTRRAAAEVLPRLRDGVRTKADLLAVLRQAPSVDVVAAVLYALGCGWAQDADVRDCAVAARGASDPAVAIEAIRVRARLNEAEESDFDRFFELKYGAEKIPYEMPDRQLTEHFAATKGPVFAERLVAAIEDVRVGTQHRLMPLVGSLVLCDAQHPQVAPCIQQLLNEEWNVREMFAERRFPAEKVDWKPEHIATIERWAAKDEPALRDYELYWVVKVLPLPALKAQLLKNLRDPHLRFWPAKALVESWGGGDAEVRAALAPFADADPKDIAQVAEVLPAVMDDKHACRATLLRALRAPVERVDFLFRGLETLGISPDDEELYQVCLGSRAHIKAPVYEDQWREHMILGFPQRSEIRELARQELNRHHGRVDAVAKSYSADEAMTSELLHVLAPLPEASRLVVVSALRDAAMADGNAVSLLEKCREDTEGAVAFESTVGWMEALSARGAIEPDHVAAMAKQLHAVGPDYPARRAAAVIGLAIAGRLDLFEQAGEHGPLKIASARGSWRDDDRYLRYILPFWPQFTAALGSEPNALERLEMTAETIVPLLSPMMPNAAHVFEVLISETPLSPHVAKHSLLSALARFAPRSDRLRAMVLSQLTQTDRVEYWGALISAEVFAEQFSDDTELRADVIAAFSTNPRGFAAAALAELVLRNPDPDVERMLRGATLGELVFTKPDPDSELRRATAELQYDIATGFKLIAALSTPERVLDSLTVLMEDRDEVEHLQLARWVPAMLRRIELDAEVQTLMKQMLNSVSDASAKASFTSLLRRAVGVDDQLRGFASVELERSANAIVPAIGFDLTSGEHRIVAHVLSDLLI